MRPFLFVGFKNCFLVCMLAMVLAACGGNGGSSGSAHPESQAPTVTIETYTPGDPMAGEDVQFTAVGTGVAPLGYAWDFGDGTTNTVSGANATQRYSAEGNYTVTLTLTDGGGRTVTAQRAVPVVGSYPAPKDACNQWTYPTPAREGYNADCIAKSIAFKTGTLLGTGDGLIQQTLFPPAKVSDCVGANNGDSLYYRIPLILVAKNGNIISVVNGRWCTVADSANGDVELRVSQDGGSSWGPPQIIQPYKTKAACSNCYNRLGNGVVDPVTGRIMFVYNSYGGYAISDDNGLSWQLLTNGTVPPKPAFKSNSLGGTAGFHGHDAGIALRYGAKAGRLLLPVGIGYPQSAAMPSGTGDMYSDDHGVSWQISQSSATVPPTDVHQSGRPAPDTFSGESAVVELGDGTLYKSFRMNGSSRQGKAYSHDQGNSWTEVGYSELPNGNGALARVVDSATGRAMLLFANSSNEFANIDGTLKQSVNAPFYYSLDEGKTWHFGRQLVSGASGYVAMAPYLDTGDVVLLIESPWPRFMRFNPFKVLGL